MMKQRPICHIKNQRIMNKFLIILAFILPITTLFSQIKTEGFVETVPDNGLHKIALHHELTAYAKNNLNNVRIWDEENKQVPYFIEVSKTTITASNFEASAIISRSKITDTSTTYIIKNPKKELNQLVIHLSNYQGTKRYKLLGSNNQKDWYGITENNRLRNLSDTQSTSIYKLIDFPLCAYSYLKITFDDLYSLPINIIEIGTSSQKVNTPVFNEISTESFTTENLSDQKKSTCILSFKHPFKIDKISFEINAPVRYKRRAIVYAPSTKIVNQQEEKIYKKIAAFYLDSTTDNTFFIENFWAKDMRIEIENEDNPELLISKIKCFQKASFLIADLIQGKKYRITSGDYSLKKPKYDISFFKNQVKKDLPVLNIENIKHVDTTMKEKTITPYWQKAWFMWLCIGFAGLLVLLFIPSLIKDLKQAK